MKVFYTFILLAFILTSLKYSYSQEEDIYDLDLEALMNIEIVSASKKAENIFDAPLGASVITGNQIKESGATSIMEALRLVPGVIVRETTPGNYDIHLRGYDGLDPNALIMLSTNTTALIMVNNRTVYSEFQGQTYWELLQINIDDVDRIEVVRGPVSAMYGPNAVTGTINILTKNPGKDEGFNASSYTMGGTPTSIITSTSVGYKMNNGLGIRLSGNVDYRDRHNVDYFIFSQNEFTDEITDDVLNIVGLPNLDPDHPYTGAQIGPSGLELIPNMNNDERYPDPNLATRHYAGNAHISYNTDDINLNLTGGISSAQVQRIYANNNVSALTHDSLSNYYIHLFGDYKGIKLSADYTNGSNSILGSGEVLSIAYNTLNANLEYDLKVSDNFSLKPGVSYKSTRFNALGLGSQEQYIDATTFFNNGYEIREKDGELSNSTISGYLQADFHWKSLRVIGAARVDKFEYPDKAIISPLFSATYKITDDFLVRGSYGRASRTPFMFDLFADITLSYPAGFTDPSTGFDAYRRLVYKGTERRDNESEYNLLTVDDIEVGFRHKISETFTLDIELFWSQLQNLITLSKVGNDTLADTNPLSGADITVYRDNYSFINLDAKPQQMGATMALTSVPFKKVSFQIFLTIQQTKLIDYPDAIDINGNAIDLDGDGNSTSDYYHQATPAFSGGVNMNYKPMKKLNININSYFYSHQTLTINTYNTNAVDANVLLNATATYEIVDEVKIFVTGKNLVGGNKRQYAFSDKIGPSVMGGFNIAF